ncbi:30S ribosomal protein S2 [Flavobacterium sp. ASW18X]|uniref:30S ribosomal protein S2 n=1 Tax=Flavobacterium sp. ASW18X TaxID=2572595 RepID=UPI0010ADFAE1|nr:30S ribosomal protein S2 [Flavobacterium sp. ASW18X]TKD66598.1 30S ribosomal protein S2 [Flavobacterium sp. ASW18X]
MANIEVKDLLEAGVHFGHLTRKWNPNMAPYIYMERNGIHVINLYKTAAKLDEAQEALKKIAASGRKILFVATKKQAKDIVADKVSAVNMPYITERWPGGMLTNFVTIRKAVKKMASIDRMKKDGTFNTLSKKERLQVDRLRAKLDKNLGSISDMTRLPGAIFIVDTMREHIAVKEALKLNIPIFAMVDTNSDPRPIDYIIPANDDAGKSIEIILSEVTKSIAEGLAERKAEKQTTKEDAPAKEGKKAKATKAAGDDLTKVEGVGPKAAEALVAAGIATYADLAKAEPAKIKTILTDASPRLAHLEPASWPKQAQMAADGKWDELKAWQDSVSGGIEDSEE